MKVNDVQWNSGLVIEIELCYEKKIKIKEKEVRERKRDRTLENHYQSSHCNRKAAPHHQALRQCHIIAKIKPNVRKLLY